MAARATHRESRTLHRRKKHIRVYIRKLRVNANTYRIHQLTNANSGSGGERLKSPSEVIQSEHSFIRFCFQRATVFTVSFQRAIS
ncbi:hypothetical protein BDI4_910058 [Burkholderia diffusa]|nr:hypothetical protein BDI4_910058 [Burkholderia diffusa]